MKARDLPPEVVAAIGAEPDDDVEVMGSPHQREPGYPAPAAPPANMTGWLALALQPVQTLKERGLRCWGGFRESPDGERFVEEDDDRQVTHNLWVLPGEWHRHIPNSLGLHDIFGNLCFGPHDDDIRLGCLGVGIMIKAVSRKRKS